MQSLISKDGENVLEAQLNIAASYSYKITIPTSEWDMSTNINIEMHASILSYPRINVCLLLNIITTQTKFGHYCTVQKLDMQPVRRKESQHACAICIFLRYGFLLAISYFTACTQVSKLRYTITHDTLATFPGHYQQNQQNWYPYMNFFTCSLLGTLTGFCTYIWQWYFSINITIINSICTTSQNTQ